MTQSKLNRKSVIRIATKQAAEMTLEFVPGEHPYLYLSARRIGEFAIGGAITDRDIPKLKRFVESL